MLNAITGSGGQYTTDAGAHITVGPDGNIVRVVTPPVAITAAATPKPRRNRAHNRNLEARRLLAQLDNRRAEAEKILADLDDRRDQPAGLPHGVTHTALLASARPLTAGERAHDQQRRRFSSVADLLDDTPLRVGGRWDARRCRSYYTCSRCGDGLEPCIHHPGHKNQPRNRW